MTTQKNRFGLSRYVPADVARRIRNEAGFGCVGCGLAIAQYEHIEPEFLDADSHDPERMTFLCHQCHGKVTRGHLSKETVWRWKARPKCKEIGFSFEAFDIGTRHPDIHLGSSLLRECGRIITIEDDDILSVTPPSEEGMPFEITARFEDEAGNLALEIIKNEWRASSDSWDVTVEGSRISIFSGKSTGRIEITHLPGLGLRIDRLRLYHKGNLLEVKEEGMTYTGPHISIGHVSFGLISKSPYGIRIKDGSFRLGGDGAYIQIG